ncbi:MAG: protein O-mannosyl-transferase family, partial [Bacteroidota bacterium]
MNNFRRWNLLFGWATFLVALITYVLTLEPTASWWDCGEFIACSYKLLVGHSPGAPFFMIMGRFFTLF